MARWKPGQSGNQRGRPKRKLFDKDLQAALKANRGEPSKELVRALIDKAKTGDVPALKLIAERVGGKPPAEVTAADRPEERLTRDQVRQRLAELLARPEVKSTIQHLLTEPETRPKIQ
jgi:hypothetical protein